jgi:hypothetical protein
MPMSESQIYDPLDYQNLTINLVRELMSRGPYTLPLAESVKGPGVYALFYHGDFKPYQKSCSADATKPIYVGKAVLPGGRKGGGVMGAPMGAPLFGRIKEHVQSIQAAQNLKIEHFSCRYLVVVPLWITMAERFLLEYYRPMWNVCIEGFGLHDPGKGRREGENSWWDSLHPGRHWAALQRQTRKPGDALERVKSYYATGAKGWEPKEEDSEES